jgi:tetratricopeptide (TPR) repeat protein
LKKAEQKTSLSPNRRRWFRVLGFALPILLLLLLEGILRLIGFGYPTSFFLKSDVGGQRVWIENQEFTKRFFPPGLARSPQPTVIERQKPKDTTRIFLFGESAAMGDPEPAFGFGRILEVLLAARYPERTFQVVNVSITAINSHIVREIAEDCAQLEGDIWVIYMGNNEVVGPFGAGTVFGAQTPSLGFIRANLALKSTRVGQLLETVKNRLTHQKRATWEGMEMFLKQQVPQSDPRMQKVYEHFRRNVNDVVQVARESGGNVFLCTVASNLKDCPPFASQTGSSSNALADFERATSLLRAGQTNEGRAAFVRARDLDTLRFRADSEINAIIRRVVHRTRQARHQWVESREVKLADCERIVEQASKHGIPGEEFFFEHVHFNFDGNYLIARALAEQVLVAAKAQGDWLTREDCAKRLAYTAWNEFQVLDEMVKRLDLPPFTHQLGHTQRMARLKEQRTQLEAKLKPDAHDGWIETYTHALKLAPDDWILHENFARLLQEIGDSDNAEKEWRRVTELLPHSASAWYSLGNVLDARGKGGEALMCFQRALKLNPNAVEARNGMGLVLASMGRAPEAVKEYQAALRSKPEFAEARVNLGLTLAQRGEHDAAIREYQTALRYNSNSVAAHLNLGKALMVRGDTNAAIAHYREAVRLKPDHPIAQFNLGNTLAAQGDATGLAHLAEAVRRKPDFAEAHHKLGLELTKANRFDEAVEHLEAAVKFGPNLSEAHFNLGVAYAKQKRYAEAVASFENCLRLDPQNAIARKYLDQAKRLSGQ